MKASVYDVETLVQAGRAHKADEAIQLEISVLQEAFKRVQATKKVCINEPIADGRPDVSWA